MPMPVIIHSDLKCGFSAGADLRELYERSQSMQKEEAAKGVRDFWSGFTASSTRSTPLR